MPLMPSLPAKREMAEVLSQRSQEGDLGMSPGMQYWWSGAYEPSQMWQKGESAERDAYAQ